MKDELLQIFPIPLLITKYENDLSKEINYVDNLSYTEQKQNYNFKSTNSYLLELEELKNLKNFFYESLNKFTKNISQSDQRLVITQCWANKNPPGSRHHEHVHPNSILSGVFYLRQDKTLPPIQFAKSVQAAMKLDPKKYNNLNSESFILPCTAGELLLFPSDLKHSVPINTGTQSRLSISFNTFSIDALGSENSLTHLDIRRIMNEHN
mgnify:FL=1|tara:strand:- start:2 stop:628 length:627 start_codon:yes stop_codon:yes gene_type:complete